MTKYIVSFYASGRVLVEAGSDAEAKLKVERALSDHTINVPLQISTAENLDNMEAVE